MPSMLEQNSALLIKGMNFVAAVSSLAHPHMNGGLVAASLQDFPAARPVLQGRQL